MKTQGFARKSVLATCVGVVCWCGVAVRASDVMAEPELARFDGRGWYGLALEQTRTDEAKRTLRSLSAERSTEVRALPETASDAAPITAFRVTYGSESPDVAQLRMQFGEEPEVWYARERFSDWRVLLFRDRGVAAFAQNVAHGEEIPLLFLSTPERAAQIVQGMSRTATPLRAYNPKAEASAVAATFEQVRAIVREEGVRVSDREELRDALEQSLREQPGTARLRHAIGGGGAYVVEVRAVKEPGQEGRIDVTLALSAETPYGRVRAARLASRRLPRGLFNTATVPHSIVMEALQEAQSGLAQTVEAALKKTVPPDPDTRRVRVWKRLMDTAASNE